MPSKKSQKALQFTIERFPSDIYLWTFTWRKPTLPKDGAKKWGNFLHGKSRRGGGFRAAFPFENGVRVFELHPGADRFEPDLSHGLHVHALFIKRLPVDIMRAIWEREGDGGRIHVKKIPREKAMYVGKYLSKARDEILDGVRLWAGFGPDHEASKVKDIQVNSKWTQTYRLIARSIGGWDRLRWDQRARMTTAFCMGANFDQALLSIGMTPEIGMTVETDEGEQRYYDREAEMRKYAPSEK